MLWSDAHRGKKVVKKIVAEIDSGIRCEILEPIGEDFDRQLYPVVLRRGRRRLELKVPMRELGRISDDGNLQRKLRQRLERLLHRRGA